MSTRALARSSSAFNARRARWLRQNTSSRARPPRPWSDIAVAGTALQATTAHPAHIKGWQLATAVAAVVTMHLGLVWYFNQHIERRPDPRPSQLSVEIVRPPKPPEPPKVEPPKPPPPKAPPKETRPLPQIQQSEPLPAAEGESSEPPVAVAPIAPEPEPAPPPPPEPVTEPIGRAGYLNNPAPDYPPLAVRQGWQGTVLLRVRVLANGTVAAVEIQQSSGRRILDDEAMQTVKRWSFTPSKRGSTPIDGWATVPIEFLLDQ